MANALSVDLRQRVIRRDGPFRRNAEAGNAQLFGSSAGMKRTEMVAEQCALVASK
jgi:hypothetical protein